MLFGGLKLAAKGVGLSARLGFGATKYGLGGATAVTKFALNNPRSAMALTGLAASSYLIPQGPGGSGMDERAMSAIVQRNNISSTGFSPGMGASYKQEDRQMFMESTFGLTQGLNRGRHGG